MEVHEMMVEIHNIDKSLAVLNQKLEDHTVQDSDNFDSLNKRLDTIEIKVDLIRTSLDREAGFKEAARAEGRKTGLTWGASTSTIVIGVWEALKYYLYSK